MPTYEYVCDACGHKFDEFQSFSADPLKKCPECKKNALRRLFGTGAAILFKGSGFYQTDYRSESYKSGEKADKPAETPAADSGSNGAAKGAAEGGAKPAKGTGKGGAKSSGKPASSDK